MVNNAMKARCAVEALVAKTKELISELEVLVNQENKFRFNRKSYAHFEPVLTFSVRFVLFFFSLLFPPKLK